MSFVYGIVLVMVGSVSANLGNNLVSLGHINTHNDKIAKQKSSKDLNSVPDSPEGGALIAKKEEEPAARSWTTIGRIIFVIGNLFNFAAFAFGAQSILSSLESVEFVSNVFFVHYVHCEPITTRMSIATLLIIAGNVLVVVFGEQSAKNFTSDDMIHLYKHNTAYHAYLLLVGILWAVTSYAYSTYHHSRMKKRVLMWRHSFVEPLCYAVSSSIVGTQAVLNSKCLALLIDATSTGAKNEFARWYLYMVLGTWLLMVAYWLVRLDQGLALFPPAFIIPLMQVVFMIFAILCGGIYFQEFIHFSTTQYILFSVGVVLIVFGVYGLAPLDMKLYVPGDPDAPDPVLMCEQAYSANVHSELILPVCSHCQNHRNRHGSLTFCAVCKNEDSELDRMFDGKLHDKPQPTYEDMTGFSDAKVHPIAVGAGAEAELEETLSGPVQHKPSVNDLTDLTEEIQHFDAPRDDTVAFDTEEDAKVTFSDPVEDVGSAAELVPMLTETEAVEDAVHTEQVQEVQAVAVTEKMEEMEETEEKEEVVTGDSLNAVQHFAAEEAADNEVEEWRDEEPDIEASDAPVQEELVHSVHEETVDIVQLDDTVVDDVTDFVDARTELDSNADATPGPALSQASSIDANFDPANTGETVESERPIVDEPLRALDLPVVELADVEDLDATRDNVIDFAQPQMVQNAAPKHEHAALVEEVTAEKATPQLPSSVAVPTSLSRQPPASTTAMEEEKAVFEVAIHQKTQLSQPDQEDDDGEDFDVIELPATDSPSAEGTAETANIEHAFAANADRAKTAPTALRGPPMSLLPAEDASGVARALVNNYTATSSVTPFTTRTTATDKHQHFDAPDGARGAPPAYAIASKSRRAAPAPHSYSLRADASETNPETD